MKTNSKTRSMTALAMVAALSYVVMVFGRVPIVMFLKYDPKDFLLALCGLVFGPLQAIYVTVVVAFVEMFTVSDTGIIGFLMNVIASAAFIIPVSVFYKRDRSMKSVVLGLLVSTISMTAVMLLWNFIITPIYMKVPRAEVVKLLVPVILPFNLFKATLNSALVAVVLPKLGYIKRVIGIHDGADEKVSFKESVIVFIALAITAVAVYMILK